MELYGLSDSNEFVDPDIIYAKLSTYIGRYLGSYCFQVILELDPSDY